jgi:sec-independent protein translocase protein TatC
MSEKMKEAPLIDHLDELRRRLVFILISVGIFFLVSISFSKNILNHIIDDLVRKDIQIISISPAELIMADISVALYLAVILCVPIIIYHGVLFVKPALGHKERQAVGFILPGILILFLMGMVFAYFIFLPVAFLFLSYFSSGTRVVNMWSVGRIVGFVFATLFLFGLVFLAPIVLLLLERLGIMSVRSIRKKRKYVYVLVFVVAAILTPPDIITQVIISIPVLILFEMSIVVLRLFQ